MKKSKKEKAYILIITLAFGALVFYILLVSTVGLMDFSLLKQKMHKDYCLDGALGTQDFAIAEVIYNPSWDHGFKKKDLDYPDTDTEMIFWKKPDATASPHPKTSPVSGKKDVAMKSAMTKPIPTKTPTPKPTIPYCTNNFGSFDPAVGWNDRNVPPGYVHIVTNSKSERVKKVREALVNPYYLLFFEDFNANGKGTEARNEWNFMKGTKGYLIKDSFLFMGSPEPMKNMAEYATAGKDYWTDYDFISNLAYYGNDPFALYFRCKDFEGYAFLISPLMSGNTIEGATVEICRVDSDGENWVGFDVSDVLYAGNPFEADKIPAFWKLQVSVEDDKAWLCVNEKVATKKFDLAKGGKIIKSGYIGFWTEENGTEIGVTRVIVNKRGLAMITIPSQW